MRHGKKVNHLGRKTAHRKALLRNLTIALITHKRINTTLAKAKALRVFAEPLITKSKANDTHNRRVAFSYLQDKVAVEELFSTIADKVADRPGGYLRVIKTGFRLGDGAEMAMIELVDFNEVYNKNADKSGGKTRRSRRRRGGSSSNTPEAATAAPVAAAALHPLPKPRPPEKRSRHPHTTYGKPATPRVAGFPHFRGNPPCL